MRKNDFDLIAPFYDGLANIIFGRSIRKSQQAFLNIIPEGSRILIIGGGTGWLLSYLDKLKKRLKIVYLDASGVMIKKSKARGPFEHIDVSYKKGTHTDLSDMDRFDVVITNFFLDVFNAQNLPVVVFMLNDHLVDNGIWIVTDFHKISGKWHNYLLKIMYWFFQLTTNLEGNKLLNFDLCLQDQSLKLSNSRKFYRGMIQSKVYKKL